MKNRILASGLVIGLFAAFSGSAAADDRRSGAMSPGSSTTERSSSDMRSDTGSSVGQFIDDATVTTRVKTRFATDEQVSALNIDVDTNDGVVQLSGYAGSESEKARAAAIASEVPDVKSVQNNIVVRGIGDMDTGSGSTGGSRSYDTPSGSSGSGSSGSGYR